MQLAISKYRSMSAFSENYTCVYLKKIIKYANMLDLVQLLQSEKNMKPDWDSNTWPSEYRSAALSTELSGRFHNSPKKWPVLNRDIMMIHYDTLWTIKCWSVPIRFKDILKIKDNGNKMTKFLRWLKNGIFNIYCNDIFFIELFGILYVKNNNFVIQKSCTW
jgi:hypothetical protein